MLPFCVIPLTKGYYTLVDQEDFDQLRQWSWFAKVGGTGGDAYTARSARVNGKITTIRMHRQIMEKELSAIIGKREVDHINHNTLDNRRKNLRVVTKEQNLQNRSYPKVCSENDDIPF
jgi:hypothetical protein